MSLAGIPLWAVLTVVAGSAGALAILHLLRVRPREVRVVTTLFWSRVVEQPRARTLLQRFRHLRTYLLLLLVCALLAFALGRPVWSGESARRVWEVIVIDAGASMSARDETDGTRFDAAQKAAISEANALSSDDRVAIVVANPLPRLVQDFSDPRPLIRSRLREVAVDAAPPASDEALSLARSLLHDRTNARLVWITDNPVLLSPTTTSDQTIKPRVIHVGTPENNAAVVAATFEPDAASPLTGSFIARVGYWGDRATAVKVTIQRVGGAPLLNETREMAPSETQDFAVSELPADGDEITVELASPDAVSADNKLTFRLPYRAAIRVAVEGELPDALRAVLSSDPSVAVVAADEEHDVDVVCGRTPIEPKRPLLLVPDGGPLVPAPQRVQVDAASAWASGLDFEGASCGIGASLGPADGGTERLLTAGAYVLASITPDGPTPCFQLAPALVAEDSAACRRSAFAILASRGLRHVAGWDELPVVLTPERAVEDPLWARRMPNVGDAITMPGSRDASDLSKQMSAGAADSQQPERRWAMLAPFEIILAVALAMFAIEAILHTRGRIP